MPTYDEEVDIDEASLDLAWIDQPRLVLKYGAHAAALTREISIAKDRVDFVKGSLSIQIRNDPRSFGIGTERVTEGAIQSAIETHPDFVAARQAMHDKQREYDTAQAVMRSLEHRKVSLEHLVKLHAAQYFAGPSAPRDIGEERRRRANAVVRIRRA